MGRTLVVVALAALVLATDAGAAITLVFDRLSARPGESVRVVQPGAGLQWLEPDTRIRVYLITARQAQELVWPPGGGLVGTREGPPPLALRRHYLGVLLAAKSELRFRVPRVPAGRYTTLVWTPWNAYFPSFDTAYDDRYFREPPPQILRVRR